LAETSKSASLNPLRFVPESAGSHAAVSVTSNHCAAGRSLFYILRSKCGLEATLCLQTGNRNFRKTF
jgi:hypothetical protein